MKPSERIQKPDFDVPDLTADQQKATGLPADFWEAFDLYFADVKTPHLGSYGRAVSALKRLVTDNEPTKECRVIEVIPGSALLHVIDHDLCSALVITARNPGIVAAAGRVYEEQRRMDQARLWDIITSGRGPAWLFLPIRSRRRLALEAVAQEDFGTVLTPEYRDLPEHVCAVLSPAKARRLRRKWMDVQSFARWPGSGRPPSLSGK